MNFSVRAILGMLCWQLLTGCVSLNQSKQDDLEPPELTSEMSLSEIVEAGLDFGDKTLQKSKKLIEKRNQRVAAGAYLHKVIIESQLKMPATKLINAMNLYQFTAYEKAPQLFYILSQSDRNLSQQLAWHLAASMPSTAMGQQVERTLSQAIANNEIQQMYLPKMASAVANNNLIQSYTVVRQGLFDSNHVDFARAMITLDPRQASHDFLDYLAKAPVSELRQLSVKSVDVFACMEIFKHLLSFPVDAAHPRFDHLFLYSISRNNALSDMARKVLVSFFPSQNNHLALMLARMPNWVQVAFVEGARRQLNPQISLFLRELKKTTSQREVLEEIDHVIR
ncbi:MAG: hypothetical protein HRU09_07155 [Oligoflexales bacterium]|nr:hypothetical protein [Oligoflexales bacterium]